MNFFSAFNVLLKSPSCTFLTSLRVKKCAYLLPKQESEVNLVLSVNTALTRPHKQNQKFFHFTLDFRQDSMRLTKLTFSCNEKSEEHSAWPQIFARLIESNCANLLLRWMLRCIPWSWWDLAWWSWSWRRLCDRCTKDASRNRAVRRADAPHRTGAWRGQKHMTSAVFCAKVVNLQVPWERSLFTVHK